MAEARLLRARDSLRERVVVACPFIIGDVDVTGLSTMELLLELARAVRVELDRAKFWLLVTCISGAMPTRDEFMRGFRALELAAPGTEHHEVLRACVGPSISNDDFLRPIRIVHDQVIIDVNFCARHGHNTGVQRVVRETVRRWDTAHHPTLVAWTGDGALMRSLAPGEESRVLRWDSSMRAEASAPDVDLTTELIVPWNCSIILPEVAQFEIWDRLACLAEFSSSRVGMVGYDMIPVTSAEYVIPSEADRFIRYLSIVKHATILVGISASSADEFAGFSAALEAQGLRGPVVSAIALPVEFGLREEVVSQSSAVQSGPPLVLCVGTQEPRKNQLAVLAASEVLWKEGLVFDLLFIGGSAIPLSRSFDDEVSRLQRRGRTVTVLRKASDVLLHDAYRRARFSIFVSLHEGFGLPVGESLAVGTPVITSDYGSIAEIARGGGCLSVDPRSDEAITNAMRVLLTNDVVLERLRTEASSRVTRTWDDYAEELWEAMMAGTAK